MILLTLDNMVKNSMFMVAKRPDKTLTFEKLQFVRPSYCLWIQSWVLQTGLGIKHSICSCKNFLKSHVLYNMMILMSAVMQCIATYTPSKVVNKIYGKNNLLC